MFQLKLFLSVESKKTKINVLIISPLGDLAQRCSIWNGSETVAFKCFQLLCLQARGTSQTGEHRLSPSLSLLQRGCSGRPSSQPGLCTVWVNPFPHQANDWGTVSQVAS